MPDGKRVVKPVITVNLLPEWSEEKYQALLGEIVKGAKLIPGWNIKDEKDIIVHLPADRMKKGLGEEIHIEVATPELSSLALERISKAIFEDMVRKSLELAVMTHLPYAHIQCEVRFFAVDEGFR